MNQIAFWLSIIFCKVYTFPIQCFGNGCFLCTNSNCQPCIGANCFNSNFQSCTDGLNCQEMFQRNSNTLSRPCIGSSCSSQTNSCIGPNCPSQTSCTGLDCSQPFVFIPQNSGCVGASCNTLYNGGILDSSNVLFGFNNFNNAQPCFGTNCQPCSTADCFKSNFNYDPCYGVNCPQSAPIPVVYKQPSINAPIPVVQQQPVQVVQYSAQQPKKLTAVQPSTQILQPSTIITRPVIESSTLPCTGNNCNNPTLKIVIPTNECTDVECLINIICPNGKCTNLPKFDKKAKRSS